MQALDRQQRFPVLVLSPHESPAASPRYQRRQVTLTRQGIANLPQRSESC
jgi:hypothetical protein